MKNITAYGRTDIGKKRSVNQDSIIVNDKIGFYAVADGMGGHQGGEIASAMAVEIIESALKQIDGKKQISIPSFLKEAVSLASIRIHERASMDHTLKGMGTTLVSLYFNGPNCYISQVGDSRVYLYRDGLLWKITEDHSLVNEQIRSGLITKAQAEKLAYKNVITRSVGFEEAVVVDVYERQAEKGDLFVLCSDGLSSMISDEEIKQNIEKNNIKASGDCLINKANDAGGHDNVSVILVRVD